MNLYEKLVHAFKTRAASSTPGNNLVLGENNNVPEMLADIAIKTVYEHQNLEERNDRSEFPKYKYTGRWKKYHP